MKKRERDTRILLMRSLKELRKEKNISQETLARFSTIAVGTISRMENFRGVLSYKVLSKLTYTFLCYDMPKKKSKIGNMKQYKKGNYRKFPRELLPLE